jgi:hypothetical protein
MRTASPTSQAGLSAPTSTSSNAPPHSPTDSRPESTARFTSATTPRHSASRPEPTADGITAAQAAQRVECGHALSTPATRTAGRQGRAVRPAPAARP